MQSGVSESTEPIANQRDIGFGNANTNAIVNNCTEANTAAKICSELSLNGYDDWFLPTTHELNYYTTIKTGWWVFKYKLFISTETKAMMVFINMFFNRFWFKSS